MMEHCHATVLFTDKGGFSILPHYKGMWLCRKTRCSQIKRPSLKRQFHVPKRMMNQWMERGVLLYFQVHNPNIISSCLEIPRMSLLFFKNPKCSWLPSGNQTWFALKSPMYGGFWKLEPPSWSGISSQLWLITGGYSFPNDMGNWRTVQSQI
jgi:hypothetical protein